MRYCVLVSVAVALAGCETTGGTSTAATQVLGQGAIAVPLRVGGKPPVGHVFRVTPDGVREICAADFRENRALKAITSETTASTDVVVETSWFDGFSVQVPPVPKMVVPYHGRLKVKGYSVTTAAAPAGDLRPYVVANVSKKCRGYLGGNDVVVVSARADAVATEKLSRLPVSGTVSVGAATWGLPPAEFGTHGPSNATFGVLPTPR